MERGLEWPLTWQQRCGGRTSSCLASRNIALAFWQLWLNSIPYLALFILCCSGFQENHFFFRSETWCRRYTILSICVRTHMCYPTGCGCFPPSWDGMKGMTITAPGLLDMGRDGGVFRSFWMWRYLKWYWTSVVYRAKRNGANTLPYGGPMLLRTVLIKTSAASWTLEIPSSSVVWK